MWEPPRGKREQLQIDPAVQDPDERDAGFRDRLDIRDGLGRGLALERLHVDRVPHRVGARVRGTLVIGEALRGREHVVDLT